MVATRLNGTAEIVRTEYNGLLVPPRDATALADAILRFLQNPELRERLAARGPESVAEYSTSIMIAKFNAAYEKLYATRSADESATYPARLGGGR